MSDKIYDVAIVGAGPAGLSAALYAGRSRMSTLLIEKKQDGGQVSITDLIENYPGCIDGETGPMLISRMSNQAKKFGTVRVKDTIVSVNLDSKIKTLQGEKEAYQAKSVIFALGAYPRQVGCPGEKELIGKGVSYCATCDAALFEDMEVFVIGGGDSAVEEALYLTKFARKVTIVHRRNELRAVKSLQEKAFSNCKIHFMWDSVLESLEGDGILEKAVFKNVKTGDIKVFDAPEEDGTFGVFVFIGVIPETKMLKGLVDMENDYIITDETMATKIPGVFAAGDCCKKSLRQIVTAAADGAIAATEALHYVENNFKEDATC
ncbi:MAG: thioredoxin-disulfide reductase [Christensenellaceae bacterium]|nr:thioredoxin-disulfide reductase [Christensenellaceae bacterium]